MAHVFAAAQKKRLPNDERIPALRPRWLHESQKKKFPDGMPAVSAVGVPVAQGAAVPEVLITAESQSPAPRPDGVQVHIANVDAEATAIQAATRTWSFIGTLRIVINTRVRPHPHLKGTV